MGNFKALSNGVKDNILRVTVVPIFSNELRRRAGKICQLNDLLELVLSFKLAILGRAVSIQPVQIRREIEQLAAEVAKLRPRVVVEIGTANGGTLFLWSRVARPDATILSVDLPGGPFGGGYNKWRTGLYKSFALPKQQLYLLRMDSHSPETSERVKSLLGDREVDFLFIDGDHSYDGVKKDFEMYSALVRRGGVIAFHDIVPHTRATGVGVPIFWSELKQQQPSHLEFVEDWNQGSCGIGLIKAG